MSTRTVLSRLCRWPNNRFSQTGKALVSIGIFPWDKKPSEFLFESRTIDDSFQPTTVYTEPANQSHCFPNCSQWTRKSEAYFGYQSCPTKYVVGCVSYDAQGRAYNFEKYSFMKIRIKFYRLTLVLAPLLFAVQPPPLGKMSPHERQHDDSRTSLKIGVARSPILLCYSSPCNSSILHTFPALHTMDFDKSTQAKSWIFDETSLRACRERAVVVDNATDYSTTKRRVGGARSFASGFHRSQQLETDLPTCQTDRFALASEDQEALVRFHAHQIQTLIGPTALLVELRTSVRALSTAISFFRRFYLSNSVINFSPRKMAAASAFFAAKVEEEKIEVSYHHRLCRQKRVENNGGVGYKILHPAHPK